MNASKYTFFIITCAVLVGVGVGMEFGGWFGMAAGFALFALSPIHPGAI